MTTDRTTRITNIIEGYTAFPNEAFEPRSTTGRVFKKPLSWFGKHSTLRPVAFTPRINMIESMGCASISGGMRPYIWLDAKNRLVGQINDKYVQINAESLSDDDIADLEIGTRGDSSLLAEIYDMATQKMFDALA